MYLSKQLENVIDSPDKKTQRVLLCSWLIELSIANLKRLEAIAEGDLPETATLLQKQQKQEAIEVYERSLSSFRAFLAQCESDVDTETIFQLLQSHGRLDDFLYFASQKKNYEAVVLHYINHREFTKALNVLTNVKDSKVKFSLMVRYASIFMKHIARATIEALSSGFKDINVDELLPTLLNLETKDRSLAIDYIRELMDKSTNQLLHNLYIFFLAQSEEKENTEELLDFLDQQETLQKRNQPIFLDKDFALNVCKYFNKIEGQIRVYGMLEFYEEAVKLAVRKKKFDLAKRYANLPSDEKIQKKLWLEIAKAILQDYNAENKTGLEILNECKNLTIGDLLPFVSPKVKLATFRNDLLESLQNYGSKINGIKRDMAELNKCSQEINDQLQEASNTLIPVSGGQYCEKCKAPLLGSEKIFIFPCTHGFHKDCLLNWIGTFKMYVPAGKIDKLERIETISKKVNGLIMKKREREAEEPMPESKGLLWTIGSFFGGNRSSIMEERPSLLTPEEAEALNLAEKQLETLLSDECFLCGSMYIETLDMPFDSPDEYVWSIC